MKQWMGICLLAVMLCGCRAEETLETVSDEWLVPAMAQPREISVRLPQDTVVPVLEQEGRRLYMGQDYEIMVETMAGLLSGGAMLSNIHAWNKNPDQSGNVGHLIIAMDPRKLNPNIDMPKRTEEMIEELAAAKKAPGVDRILFPGQLEHEREAIAKTEGINLPQATLDALQKVAAYVNIPFEVE